MKSALKILVSVFVLSMISSFHVFAEAKSMPSENITLYIDEFGEYYIKCKEMNDYFGKSNVFDYIIRSVSKYNTNSSTYIYAKETNTGITCFSTLHTYPDIYVLKDDEFIIMQDFLSSNYPKISLENTSEHNYTLNYEGSVTFKEQMQIAQDIKNNTGLCFDAHFLADVLDVTIMEDFVYTPGDLNQSGTPDMSDAVSLMAHATNPEAYPLTDLQILLGDVYQQGDGIGINDAVSIQKYLTKQIDSLPESTM